MRYDAIMETEGQKRTKAARNARSLAKWRRWARELRAAGWTVIEPGVSAMGDNAFD